MSTEADQSNALKALGLPPEATREAINSANEKMRAFLLVDSSTPEPVKQLSVRVLEDINTAYSSLVIVDVAGAGQDTTVGTTSITSTVAPGSANELCRGLWLSHFFASSGFK
jgi:hypothetical protein